ncbi:uncharacterized protein TM35_000371800 [Trypanosoma theileri]|uniref:Uncharacterized protein n=1 Tax=Trypanosoma theileri TaxID=67003 RepID=A0A1X0NKL9_9TRYP|nr:uncharacterized protein TM35_000371800 [Trypanosoma theileri]ORC85207.1 hypothetical protein TM35_000371800 [Trypanosoma theileri]
MMFIQLYSLIVTILADLIFLFRLCVLRQTLSEATMVWFDKAADSTQGSLLLSVFLIYLALPKLFLLYEPLSRWILLVAAIGESLRVVVFSVLFSEFEGATELNTFLLTLFAQNAWLYWYHWYTTYKMFSRRSK